jgi:methyl-accepting chemotaxis protein
MKVSHRLALLAALLLTVAALIGATGLKGIQEGVKGLNTVYQDRVIPLKQLRTVADLYAVNIVDTTHKAADGSLSPALALQKVNEAERELNHIWQAYMATQLVAEEVRLAGIAVQQMKDTQSTISHLKNLLQQNDLHGLQIFRAQELYPAIDPIGGTISALIDVQLQVAGEQYRSAAQDSERSQWLTGILLALGLFAGIAIAWRTIYTLTKQLGAEPIEVVAIANRIAQGQLHLDITLRKGDQSSVLAAMHAMSHKLQHTMLGISQAAHQLTASSQDLASTSEQVMASSSEQSDAAACMAAAIEELTTSIAQISDHADLVHQDSSNSNQIASRGERVMQEASDDMQATLVAVQQTAVGISELSAHTQQITQIVQVIKDIADQTNLLALNAAIEAARAGEGGRGFAVVADEVRKLAERTTNSTQEIVSMIETVRLSSEQASNDMQISANHVDAGASRATAASLAMNEIQGAVSRIGSAVHGISASLQEQRSTSQLVAVNVERVAQMTEENSAATHSLNGSARAMMETAIMLKKSVAQFQLA